MISLLFYMMIYMVVYTPSQTHQHTNNVKITDADQYHSNDYNKHDIYQMGMPSQYVSYNYKHDHTHYVSYNYKHDRNYLNSDAYEKFWKDAERMDQYIKYRQQFKRLFGD